MGRENNSYSAACRRRREDPNSRPPPEILCEVLQNEQNFDIEETVETSAKNLNVAYGVKDENKKQNHCEQLEETKHLTRQYKTKDEKLTTYKTNTKICK